MALVTGIDWTTLIITIGRAAMTLKQTLPFEIRVLDVNALHLELRALGATPDWRMHNRTHNRNEPTEVSGVVLEQVIRFLPNYTYTFEPGAYIVEFNAANTNLGDLVNYNQVSIRPNNSAGLTTSFESQQLVFDGKATIDQVNGVPGQTYPVGSTLPGKASSNFSDTKFIADFRGFKDIFIIGDASLTTGLLDFSAGYRFVSSSPISDVLTVDAVAIVDNCRFYRLQITGSLDSNCTLDECVIRDLLFFQGSINYSWLVGTIVLGGGLNAGFINCFDLSVDATPTIDMGVSGQQLSMTGFEGAINFSNYNEPNTAKTNFVSGVGKVEFTPTCTKGIFVVFGEMRIVNNAGPNFTVIDRTSIGQHTELLKTSTFLALKDS